MPRIPPFLAVPAWPAVVGVILPLVYLVIRALGAEVDELKEIVFRPRNLELARNTLLLTFSTLITTTIIAFPLSFLITRTTFKGNALVSILGVVPLALPAYVAAYAYIAAGGNGGAFHSLFGLVLPTPSGFWSSLFILTLFTFPYLFLNFRSAFLSIDPSLEEASSLLGKNHLETWRLVILPALRPAWLSGALLIALHVLSDFAVVSMMRFPTFSAAIYQQYAAAYDRVYAAWLALLLLALTSVILITEWKLLKGLTLSRVSTGVARQVKLLSLSLPQSLLAWLFLACISIGVFIIPVGTIFYWIKPNIDWPSLWNAASSIVWVASITSITTTLLAFIFAYIGNRYSQNPQAKIIERIAYLGYATPPLAFALALIFFTLRVVPALYQTTALLIIAYTLHFAAEAIGPLRSGLIIATKRLEEAAQVLGFHHKESIYRVTLQIMRPNLLISACFIFLSTIKELPLTLLLSPPNFDALSRNVWTYTEEAQYAEAAPYALCLVFVGILLSLLLLKRGKHT